MAVLTFPVWRSRLMHLHYIGAHAGDHRGRFHSSNTDRFILSTIHNPFLFVLVLAARLQPSAAGRRSAAPRETGNDRAVCRLLDRS